MERRNKRKKDGSDFLTVADLLLNLNVKSTYREARNRLVKSSIHKPVVSIDIRYPTFWWRTRNSIGGFCLSVGPSVGHGLVASAKMCIYDAAVVIVCVCEVWEGVNRGCMFLPTHSQRYCRTASFVFLLHNRCSFGNRASALK